MVLPGGSITRRRGSGTAGRRLNRIPEAVNFTA
jgi:hypothetical protein